MGASTTFKIAPGLLRRLKRGDLFSLLIRFRKQLRKQDNFSLTNKIVNLKHHSNQVQEQMLHLLKKEGAEAVYRSRGKKAADYFDVYQSWLGNFIVVQAERQILSIAAGDPNVVSISENRLHRIPAPMKTDGAKPRLRERRSRLTWGLERIGIDRVWTDLNLRGKGVKIGHLDTGIDPDHPDLKDKMAGSAMFDQFGRRIRVNPYLDTGYHGTHTAGTIVGGETSGVSIGVAPESTLYSAIVLPNGTGTTAQIVGGMEWLMEQSVRVMNISLGGTGYDPGFESAIQEIAASNVFPAVSIGNEGLGVTGSPGNILGAVGVGSLDMNGNISDFSGGGTLTWYDAGGQKHHVEKPDLVAPGEEVYSCVPTEFAEIHQKLSGTSMAAPHVAGVAALMIQKKKNVTFPEMLNALQETSRSLDLRGSANRWGRGLIRAYEAISKI